LIYADNDIILDGRVHTVKNNTDVLLVGSKEIGLKVNVDKTQYMFMSRGQNAEISH